MREFLVPLLHRHYVVICFMFVILNTFASFSINSVKNPMGFSFRHWDCLAIVIASPEGAWQSLKPTGIASLRSQ